MYKSRIEEIEAILLPSIGGTVELGAFFMSLLYVGMSNEVIHKSALLNGLTDQKKNQVIEASISFKMQNHFGLRVSILEHTMSKINTVEAALSFLEYVSIKELTEEERVKFIGYITPLITNKEEAKSTLQETRSRTRGSFKNALRDPLGAYRYYFSFRTLGEILRGLGENDYHDYLEREETEYLLYHIVQFFEKNPRELFRQLDKSDAEYVKRVIESRAKGECFEVFNGGPFPRPPSKARGGGKVAPII